MPRKALSREEVASLLEEETECLLNFKGRVMVNVSGGSASAVAWYRCLCLYGESHVFPVFADTCSEDEDLYRFLDDCEKEFGQKITRLSSGKDIWDVFDETGIMRIAKSGNACKASIILKQQPLDQHFLEHQFDAQAVGIQYDEPERITSLKSRKQTPLLFPLVLPPRLGECLVHEEIRKLGLKLPRLYEQEFTHNNCGGGCILAGLAQWNAFRLANPEGFAYAKEREEVFTARTGFTVLRDQSDGEVKSYTLAQLETDAEAGKKFRNDWKSQCSCMEPPEPVEEEGCF